MSEIIRIIDQTFKRRYYHDAFEGEVNFSKNKKLTIERSFFNRLITKYNTALEENKFEWRLDLQSEILLSFVHEVFEDNSESWSRLDRNYYLSTLIHEGGIISLWSEETDGFNKQPDELDILDWEALDSVELYKNEDEIFVFRFHYKDEAFHYELFSNRFGTYNENACLLLRDFFNEIIDCKNQTEINTIEEHKSLRSKIESLIANENNYEALKELENFGNNYNTEDFFSEDTSFYYYNKTLILIEIEEYEEALNTIDIFINKSRDENEICPYANELKSEILIKMDRLLPAINCLAVSEENYTNQQFKLAAHTSKETTYSQLKEIFLTIPYEERKIIFIGNEIYSTNSCDIIILKKNNLPSNINFPVGHPHLNEVYSCHPHKKDFYLPLKSFTEELFHDRISEFSWLIQCLGALKLEITSSKNEFSEETKNSKKDLNANLDYKLSSARVDFKENNEAKSLLDDNFNIAKNQLFKPIRSPYIPTDLVWYDSETSWQRLAHQRLNGSIIMHSETISSSQCENISTSDLKRVDAELELLLPKLGVEYNSEAIVHKSSRKKYELVVHVEFEDKLSLIQFEKSISLEQNNDSNNDEYDLKVQKYKDDVLFMLEDDGIIDEGERNILNRKIKKYGISPEDAKSIEDELATSHYSDNELSYIQEIRELLEDGEISTIERKILDRYAKKFKLTSEIQKKIDTIFIN